jgi:hypothetical protein
MITIATMQNLGHVELRVINSGPRGAGGSSRRRGCRQSRFEQDPSDAVDKTGAALTGAGASSWWIGDAAGGAPTSMRDRLARDRREVGPTTLQLSRVAVRQHEQTIDQSFAASGRGTDNLPLCEVYWG